MQYVVETSMEEKLRNPRKMPAKTMYCGVLRIIEMIRRTRSIGVAWISIDANWQPLIWGTSIKMRDASGERICTAMATKNGSF